MAKAKKLLKRYDREIHLFNTESQIQTTEKFIYRDGLPFLLWGTSYKDDECNGILAFDVSLTSTGWAYGPENASEGDVIFSDLENDLQGQKRIDFVMSNMIMLLEKYKPRQISYEGYSYRSQSSAYSLGELGGLFRTLIREYQRANPFVNLYEYSPNEVKKFVTKKGNSKKELLLMYMLKFFKIESYNNNQADALGLYYIREAEVIPKAIINAEKKKQKGK